MADAIAAANISHNSGQRIIRVSSASLSGDRGRTAAAAEGPWSYPATRLQGLSQTASASRTVGFDPAPFCAAPMPNQKRRLLIARLPQVAEG
jgi:hypothetical protein